MDGSLGSGNNESALWYENAPEEIDKAKACRTMRERNCRKGGKAVGGRSGSF